ncbi:MAG: methyltransferase domain-containing protein [Desulfomonile sp.]|nr:methyltransferase domain-containing protein [Desulfomonile sp.]
MSAQGLVGRIAIKLMRPILARMSEQLLADFLADVAKARAETLPPDRGLQFLFTLDEALYPAQGWLAVAYDGGVHTKHRHTRYHDFFIDRIRPGERVLDVGCGIGALAFDIAQRSGASVVGVDLQEKHLAIAKERFSHPNVSYLLADVVRNPPEGPFDVVVLSNVLEHIDCRVEFLRGVIDKVRPTRALLRVPMFERDWRVPLKKELGMDYRLDPTHFIEYSPESFIGELEAADLLVTHQEFRWGEIWAEAVPQIYTDRKHP